MAFVFGASTPRKAPDGLQRTNETQSFQIRVAEMQSFRLRKLQLKLAEHAAEIQRNGNEPGNWESDIDSYVRLMQDYEYMNKWNKDSKDPFIITGQRLADYHVLETVLRGRYDDTNSNLDLVKVPGPWEQNIQPVGGSRDDNYWRRVRMAMLGAVFLLFPMFIMSLFNWLATCLMTACGCVVLFGLTMAWSLSEPKEILSSTAAYAAILAVFVGLSVETPQSNGGI
ncbi:hypothetical protein PG985_014242 [Apiospora marii]|uniref:uncharacterized protein n=1 Tax=Apiospora marii TaxID=335849 RepID=UPI00312E338E